MKLAVDTANQDNPDGELNIEEEKALHERVKRHISELRLQTMKGELHKAEDVEKVMTDMLTSFKNKGYEYPFEGCAGAGKPRRRIYQRSPDSGSHGSLKRIERKTTIRRLFIVMNTSKVKTMIKSEPDRKRSKDLGIDLKTIKLFEKIAKAVRRRLL